MKSTQSTIPLPNTILASSLHWVHLAQKLLEEAAQRPRRTRMCAGGRPMCVNNFEGTVRVCAVSQCVCVCARVSVCGGWWGRGWWCLLFYLFDTAKSYRLCSRDIKMFCTRSGKEMLLLRHLEKVEKLAPHLVLLISAFVFGNMTIWCDFVCKPIVRYCYKKEKRKKE